MLTEARELARHTDIKITMRYTHIGIEDQAKAVQALKCQWIGSDPGVPDGPALTRPVPACPEDTEAQKRQNPCSDRGSDAHCPNVSPDVSDDCQWRRRELNAYPASGKCDGTNDLRQGPSDLSVLCPCLDAADCRCASPHDAMLAALIAAWPSLSIEMRQAILRMASAAEQ